MHLQPRIRFAQRIANWLYYIIQTRAQSVRIMKNLSRSNKHMSSYPILSKGDCMIVDLIK